MMKDDVVEEEKENTQTRKLTTHSLTHSFSDACGVVRTERKEGLQGSEQVKQRNKAAGGLFQRKREGGTVVPQEGSESLLSRRGYRRHTTARCVRLWPAISSKCIAPEGNDPQPQERPGQNAPPPGCSLWSF